MALPFDRRGYQLPREEEERRRKQKAAVQRESDKKNPASGHGISVREAASRYHVHRSTVYRWIKKGKIGARSDKSKAGGRIQKWLNPDEVHEFAKARGKVKHVERADLYH